MSQSLQSTVAQLTNQSCQQFKKL